MILFTYLLVQLSSNLEQMASEHDPLPFVKHGGTSMHSSA
jgi:hypothetical protein